MTLEAETPDDDPRRKFIAALQQQQRIANVSSETEQHLKHEFRRLSRDASGRWQSERKRRRLGGSARPF
jgi:hypothetical protein